MPSAPDMSDDAYFDEGEKNTDIVGYDVLSFICLRNQGREEAVVPRREFSRSKPLVEGRNSALIVSTKYISTSA